MKIHLCLLSKSQTQFLDASRGLRNKDCYFFICSRNAVCMNLALSFRTESLTFYTAKISHRNLGFKLKPLHRRLRNVDDKINEKRVRESFGDKTLAKYFMVQLSGFLFSGFGRIKRETSRKKNRKKRPFERLLNFHGAFK